MLALRSQDQRFRITSCLDGNPKGYLGQEGREGNTTLAYSSGIGVCCQPTNHELRG